MITDHHIIAMRLVHEEAGRTLSRDDFDLCMRIAKRALAYLPDEYLANIRDTDIAARLLPTQITPPVQDVLGLMLWNTTPLAHALRAGGFAIERKCETEQAVALHWLLGFALKDGDDWQKTAAVALRQLTDAAKQPGDTQP
ncbi:MAG: hypothetical protein OSB38_18655 [Paraburkholderia fungorum]|nr:hypothetical protein [Paraburkholderia fungorum]